MLRAATDLAGCAALLLSAADLNILYATPGCREVLDYAPDALLHLNLSELFPRRARRAANRRLEDFLAHGRQSLTSRVTMLRQDGSRVRMRLALRRPEGVSEVVLAVLRPVSKDPIAAAGRNVANSFATHDPLTRLPMRRIWDDQLRTALRPIVSKHVAKSPESLLAVLFVDLDRFKAINDQHGHLAGDHVLRTVARRLRAAVRPADVVGRFGGDEFVVLLEKVTGQATVERIARRICRAIGAPIHWRGQRLAITASVGAKIARRDDHSARELIAAADQAMYRAKALGRLTPDIGQWALHGDYVA
ncbi:MAG: GGDEF domain-containing protein [Planctomycetia bacterium]|nr:GGDEF domain-containing protein [Planctomycetia bacterium]